MVNPTANYYFMIALTFVIASAGTIVTEKVVEPWLGKFTGEMDKNERSFGMPLLIVNIYKKLCVFVKGTSII